MENIILPSNTTPTKQPKRSLGKSLLAVLLIFVVVGVIVGKATYDTIMSYQANLKQVQVYMDYLNEPVNIETLVTNGVTEADYTNFVNKANTAGFGVFVNNTIDLDRETISLTNDITITDKEFAAFINHTFADSNSEYATLFNLLQLTLEEKPAGYELTTIAKLDFSAFSDSISQFVENFPLVVYITTVSPVIVANNTLQVAATQVFINQLDLEKNAQVIAFLNNLFQSGSDNYSLTELISLLVREQMKSVTDKTDSYVVLSDGAITFTLTNPNPEEA